MYMLEKDQEDQDYDDDGTSFGFKVQFSAPRLPRSVNLDVLEKHRFMKYHKDMRLLEHTVDDLDTDQ